MLSVVVDSDVSAEVVCMSGLVVFSKGGLGSKW